MRTLDESAVCGGACGDVGLHMQYGQGIMRSSILKSSLQEIPDVNSKVNLRVGIALPSEYQGVRYELNGMSFLIIMNI